MLVHAYRALCGDEGIERNTSQRDLDSHVSDTYVLKYEFETEAYLYDRITRKLNYMLSSSYIDERIQNFEKSIYPSDDSVLRAILSDEGLDPDSVIQSNVENLTKIRFTIKNFT